MEIFHSFRSCFKRGSKKQTPVGIKTATLSFEIGRSTVQLHFLEFMESTGLGPVQFLPPLARPLSRLAQHPNYTQEWKYFAPIFSILEWKYFAPMKVRSEIFPHQRRKIRREIIVLIKIIFSTPVKKFDVMKYFHKTQ